MTRLLVIAVNEPLPELDANAHLTVQRLCELPSAEELGRAAITYTTLDEKYYRAAGQRVIDLLRSKLPK